MSAKKSPAEIVSENVRDRFIQFINELSPTIDQEVRLESFKKYAEELKQDTKFPVEILDFSNLKADKVDLSKNENMMYLSEFIQIMLETHPNIKKINLIR